MVNQQENPSDKRSGLHSTLNQPTTLVHRSGSAVDSEVQKERRLMLLPVSKTPRTRKMKPRAAFTPPAETIYRLSGDQHGQRDRRD
jgi:hypothetical protein